MPQKCQQPKKTVATKNQTTQKDHHEKSTNDKARIKAGMPYSLLMAEG